VRETEYELVGLAHRLQQGEDLGLALNSLTMRERSTLIGMVRHYEAAPDRRRAFQPPWPGPERRRGCLISQVEARD
jgi:hypothetical protein